MAKESAEKADKADKDKDSDALPTTAKKFRQSPEIEGFYRFIYENDLQVEAYQILSGIIAARKLEKSGKKKK